MSASNRIRAIECVRNWNELFPIGTVAILEERKVKTESHAGLGPKDEPCIFVEGIEEPVALWRLDVPGWERTTKKKKASVPDGSR